MKRKRTPAVPVADEHEDEDMQEVLHEALEATRDKNGNITPDGIVQAARAGDAVLSKYFDWNVETAAKQHWLSVARHLIRSVRVVLHIKDRVISAPYYVRDPRLPPKVQGYIPVTAASKSKGLAAQVLQQELGRCEGIMKRALEYADALGLRTECEDALEQIVSVRKAVVKKAKTPRRGRPPLSENAHL